MFTGIVAAVGRISEIEPLGAGAAPAGSAPASDAQAGSAAADSSAAGVRLWVVAGGLDLSDVAIGDSIAIQGACMTVVQLDGDRFAVDVSRESLSRTVGLGAPGEVNLEKALRLADRLGGHLVSGHVDGVGRVVRFEPVGESWLLGVRAPPALGRYLAFKGSITVDGVSLTVNRIEDGAEGTLFEINLIPHTVAATTLKSLQPGRFVNLEIDLIARYVERMLSASPPA
ncbi:MAG: riboflavin synthase [Burkholderiaceae bacterium]